jgi:hypothetical protein
MHVASGGVLSSPLWGPLGVFLAVLVGVPVVWLTWRLVFARMRLSYSVLQTPLMERSEFGSQLRVIYGEGDRERQLDQARVVRLRLVSRSVKDIPTAAFADRAPLIIDLGTPVLAILGDHEPTQPPRPSITEDGNQVQIMPRLIKRGQVITINVLVDGIPNIQVLSPLIDVRVSEKTGSWLAKLGKRSADTDPGGASDFGVWPVFIAALIGAARGCGGSVDCRDGDHHNFPTCPGACPDGHSDGIDVSQALPLTIDAAPWSLRGRPGLRSRMWIPASTA